MTEDSIKSPSHYKLPGLEIESIEVIRAVLGKEGFESFCYGNVLKYLTRAGKKYGESELKDFKKSSVYINWLIESLENTRIGDRLE